MPRIQAASGPLTVECFCHLSPYKFTSASNTDNSWHPPVSPGIQRGSVPLYPDGTSVHCAPVSTKALYFCGSDVPGHRIHMVQSSLSSSWLKAGSLYSCSWSEYSLSDPCSARPEVPSPGSREVISVFLFGRALIAFLGLYSHYADSLLG